MTTIHLTDAQRDMFAASGLIVIDGERAHPDWCSGNGNWSECECFPRAAETRIPEEWRVLCDTCHGDGVDWRLPHIKAESPVAPGLMVWQPQACPNPDCVGGRRVVTLTATVPNFHAPYEDSLGRFTIPTLLPVLDGWKNTHDVERNGPAVLVFDPPYTDESGETWVVALYRSWGEYRNMPAHPMPQPGQFLARPEAAP